MKNSAHERLFKQETVNSSIRNLKSNKLPAVDSLDLVLLSVYNHETDLFRSKFDVYLQKESAKVENVKRSSTVTDINTIRRNYFHHPLVFGRNASPIINSLLRL